jgi:hypothetical protein
VLVLGIFPICRGRCLANDGADTLKFGSYALCVGMITIVGIIRLRRIRGIHRGCHLTGDHEL